MNLKITSPQAPFSNKLHNSLYKILDWKILHTLIPP